ncbi:MAG: PQQ-dependent sugar dehydrogenase [Bacteroidota bacterium]
MRALLSTNPLLRRIVLIAAALVLVAFIPKQIFMSGLNGPAAVGTYLNGTFPSTTPGVGTGGYTLVDAFPGLTFNLPLSMKPEPGSNRLMVVQMSGEIMAFDNVASPAAPTTFLDIQPQVRNGGESGMLDLAFHPRYGIDSNYVYVFYTWKGPSSNFYTRVSRFTKPTSQASLDPTSELVLIQQIDQAQNHQGGSLVFGDDGYLYVSLGDEGGGSNSYNTAQVMDERLFAGILRIDVDRNPLTSHPIRRHPSLLPGSDVSTTANYYIPNDNPFLASDSSILEEFYAIGMRNPYRAMKDPVTGQIWFGDVGQSKREEINLLYKGGNYQWAYKEGLQNGPDPFPTNHYGIDIIPVYEYDHSSNDKAIIGGTVYRGSSLPALYGKYVFADNNSRRIWSMDFSNITSPVVTQLVIPSIGSGKSGIGGFGYDANNELYVMRMANGSGNGQVMKLTAAGVAPPDPPSLLSQLNIFSDLTNMTPESYTIPYDLNVPFWSDNAIKTRYMIVPNDGTHNSAGERITYSEDGEWQFPDGSITVKHFEYQTDESNPATRKKIETRIIVQGTGNEFYGLSYKWNDAQTDATLLTSGERDTINITTPTGNRQVEWLFPSRSECQICHTSTTEGVLGPQTAQLNGDAFYPQTGRTANQLTTLASLDIFDTAPDTINLLNNAKAPEIDDNSVPLLDRTLAYLNSNCGYCHRPGSSVLANFDARYYEGNELSSVIYKQALASLGFAAGRLIIPGDTINSILLERLESVHEGYSMPPLAKNQMDSSGVALVKDWIMNLDKTRASTCPPLDFSTSSLDSYDSSQDFGTGAITNGGSTIEVQDNGWKKVDYPYTITPFTVLEFEFASTIQGEEHAIGLDTDNTSDANRVKLYGTQATGGVTGYDTYDGSGNFQHYNIPIGQLIPNGSYDRLVFIADHDAAPANGNSFFRNVLLHEGNCDLLNYQAIDFPEIPDQLTSTPSITLNATSSSGLPVSYSVVSGPATIAGNTLNLTGSEGYVVVEASQDGNGNLAAAPVVQRKFFVSPSTSYANGTGLFGRYYDNPDLTDSVYAQIDPEIDFFWSNQKPVNQMEYSTYSIMWKGELEPPFSGNYALDFTADDGIRVWIDGVLVIDEWNDHAATTFSANVNLTAWQRVPIQIEYYQNQVYAQVEMEWTHTNIDREVIPTRFLYPESSSILAASSFALDLKPEGDHLLLEWETINEKNVNFFVLEKSTDGVNFLGINKQGSKGNSSRARYQFTDTYPEPGELFYRVRMVDVDGSEYMSNTESIVLKPNLSPLTFDIFPNPVDKGHEFFLKIESDLQQEIKVEIVGLDGKVAHTESVNITAGVKPYTIQSQLAGGMYIIRLSNKDRSNKQSRKLIVR